MCNDRPHPHLVAQLTALGLYPPGSEAGCRLTVQYIAEGNDFGEPGEKPENRINLLRQKDEMYRNKKVYYRRRSGQVATGTVRYIYPRPRLDMGVKAEVRAKMSVFLARVNFKDSRDSAGIDLLDLTLVPEESETERVI